MRRDIRLIAAIFGVLTALASPVLCEHDHALNLVQIAENDLRQGRHAAAVSTLKSAVQQAPNWFVTRSRLAVAYQAAEMEQAAAQQYGRIQRMTDDLDDDVRGEDNSQLRRQLITQCEAYMTMLVNRTRQGRGKAMLYAHPKIALVARRHSREMRDKGYFSHRSPREHLRTVAERFKSEFGFQPRCVAENLVRRWRSGQGISLSLANIAESQADLFESTGHRENILRDEVSHIGIGIAINNEGDYWVTQVFADLKGHPEH